MRRCVAPTKRRIAMSKRGAPLGFVGQIAALVVAVFDRRTPWYAKVFAAGAVIVPISPIGLLLDLAPIVGWIDEAAVVAICLWLARRLTPVAARESALAKFTNR